MNQAKELWTCVFGSRTIPSSTEHLACFLSLHLLKCRLNSLIVWLNTSLHVITTDGSTGDVEEFHFSGTTALRKIFSFIHSIALPNLASKSGAPLAAVLRFWYLGFANEGLILSI